MLERGVYLPPAPFEAMMISLAHSERTYTKPLLPSSRGAEANAELTTLYLHARNSNRRRGQPLIAVIKNLTPFLSKTAVVQLC